MYNQLSRPLNTLIKRCFPQRRNRFQSSFSNQRYWIYDRQLNCLQDNAPLGFRNRTLCMWRSIRSSVDNYKFSSFLLNILCSRTWRRSCRSLVISFSNLGSWSKCQSLDAGSTLFVRWRSFAFTYNCCLTTLWLFLFLIWNTRHSDYFNII